MKRKYAYVIVAILLIAGIATFYFLNKTKTSTSSQIPYVTVTRGNISMTITGTGNLTGDVRAITLKNGVVKKVYFNVGDSVKKGDLLYELEDDNLNNQLEQAKLNLDLATQQLNQDTKNYNSAVAKLSITSPVDGVVEILVKEGQDVTPGMPVAVVNVNKSNGSEEGQPSGNSGTNVTAQVSGTVEKIYVSSGQNVRKGEVLIKLSSSNISDAQIQSDKIKVMQAQNNYNQILKQIESLKIYSPIDGKILSQNIKEGDVLGNFSSNAGNNNLNASYVQTGFVPVLDITQLSSYESQPGTAVIVGNSGYIVNLSVDETDIKNIKIGQKVQLTTDDLPGKVFSGTVSQVSQLPTIQNGVASYNVTIQVDPSEDLMLGMSMDVVITVAEKNDVLLLPIQAVQTLGNRQYVILYTDDMKNQNLSDANANNMRNLFRNNIRFIETGIHNNNFVEIVSGLQESDRVLIPLNSSLANSNNRNPQGFNFMMRPQGGFNRNTERPSGSFQGGSFNRSWQNNSSSGGNNR